MKNFKPAALGEGQSSYAHIESSLPERVLPERVLPEPVLPESALPESRVPEPVLPEQAALARITHCFNALFRPLDTQLVGGAEEPLFQPASGSSGINTIFFTRDYVASALHEIAHWCIAGEARRKQMDYGYWYTPDGRNQEQQARFEDVEVKPQALEWILSNACSLPFRLSADNLSGAVALSEAFPRRVLAQARHYCKEGLPCRAEQLCAALSTSFNTFPKTPALYSIDALS